MTEAIIVAVIVNLLATIGMGVKAYFNYKAKRSGNNPHPCAGHAKWLKELDDKLDNQAVELGKHTQCWVDNERRMKRIEGMLNGTYRK